MDTTTRPPGKTTIAPEVLLTIARLTTLDVEGVSCMYQVPGGVNRLFKRGQDEGVRIEVKENRVYIDVHVILEPDTNIRDISRNIQTNVKRAITEMVGMDVGQVNIHIEDINYPSQTKSED